MFSQKPKLIRSGTADGLTEIYDTKRAQINLVDKYISKLKMKVKIKINQAPS